MVCFQTKNLNWGKFLEGLAIENLGIFWSMYFTAIGNILRPFCRHLVYIFPVLVFCTKKNLATLVLSLIQFIRKTTSFAKSFSKKHLLNLRPGTSLVKQTVTYMGQMHKKLLSEDIFWKCKNLMVCQIHFLMVREKRTLFRRNGRLLGRVARFFLKNIPNDHKIYQMAIIYIYHMAIHYFQWP
jgi:hypothetical protein